MKEKQYQALIPQYLYQFSCLGSACEDTCCLGWRVNIDQQTYQKYRRVKHPDLEPLLSKEVTRNRTNPSKANYAKIKMNKKGGCPFLDGDKLCRIQRILGEDYLSDTCSLYPRIFNRVNGVLEASLTVSCPEAARLVLFNPEIMEFDGLLWPQARISIRQEIDTKKLIFVNKLEKYFWELRIFTIQVIQNRRYELWERLVMLGLFYQKLQEHLEQDRTKEIPGLIAGYTNMLEQGTVKKSLADIPGQPVVQMKLLKELADERFFRGINNPRYLQCFSEFLQGIEYRKESTEEEIGARYHRAYREYYQSYMEEKEYILENYLVNYVFKNLFPLGKKSKAVFDEYLMLIIHYSLIKMHLIGMAAFHQGLQDELVLKLVQSFAKTVEHNAIYLLNVRDLLKANNLATMAYAAIMIKN